MNGYDTLSAAQLAAHNQARPQPQPATSPQIRPRETLVPFREAISAADLEKLISLMDDLEDPGDGEDWDDEEDYDHEVMAEAPLDAQRRNDLPNSVFAIPGRRAYPIDTPERARSALARVRQFGSPEEVGQVRAAVRRRYPDMEVG